MSRTMRNDAIHHDPSRCMSRPDVGTAYQRASETAALLRSAGALRATLLAGDCDHANLNAHGTRCLGCGVWAHEFVAPGK